MNTVAIQWGFKQLICFVALRLYSWCEDARNGFSKLCQGFDFDDFHYGNEYSYENSTKFLLRLFPKTCSTSLNYKFDTLSYCIRHTLKKPRESILIFNALLHQIIINNNIEYFHQNEQDISRCIHSTQDIMVSSALSMYANTYKKIDDVCWHVLNNCDAIFRGKDFKNRFKVVRQIIHGDYDVEDVKNVLFESGLIGIAVDERYITSSSLPFENENDIHVFSASFEYQVKGRISFSDEKTYVVHPMCYEHFGCWIHPDCFVHPDKIDKEDIIYSILSDPM